MARRVRRLFRGGRVARSRWRARAARSGDAAARRFVAEARSCRQDIAARRAQSCTMCSSARGRGSRVASRLSPARSNAVDIVDTDIVVSSHACGALTDLVLARAAAARARVAVMPCCHDLDAGDDGGLSGWVDGALAIDHRARRCGWRSTAIASGRRRFPAASRRRTGCCWALLPSWCEVGLTACRRYGGRRCSRMQVKLRQSYRCMLKFLLWCILLVICWPWLCWPRSVSARLDSPASISHRRLSPSTACWASCGALHAARESAERTARALAQPRHFVGARRFNSSNQFNTTRNSVHAAPIHPLTPARPLMNRPSGSTS